MESFKSRLMHGWNAFRGRDQDVLVTNQDLGYVSTENPGRVRLSMSSERSIIATVTNRIALDVASFDFHHVKIDQNGKFLDTVNDSLQ